MSSHSTWFAYNGWFSNSRHRWYGKSWRRLFYPLFCPPPSIEVYRIFTISQSSQSQVMCSYFVYSRKTALSIWNRWKGSWIFVRSRTMTHFKKPCKLVLCRSRASLIILIMTSLRYFDKTHNKLMNIIIIIDLCKSWHNLRPGLVKLYEMTKCNETFGWRRLSMQTSQPNDIHFSVPLNLCSTLFLKVKDSHRLQVCGPSSTNKWIEQSLPWKNIKYTAKAEASLSLPAHIPAQAKPRYLSNVTIKLIPTHSRLRTAPPQ